MLILIYNTDMVLLLLAISVALNVVLLAIIAFVIYNGIKVYKNVYNIYHSFFIETDKDGISQFGKWLGNLEDGLTDRMQLSLANTIKGSFGGTMKGAAAELKELGIQQDPSLAIAEMLPKSIKKSPAAMGGFTYLISNVLGKLLQGANNGKMITGGSSNQEKFGGF